MKDFERIDIIEKNMQEINLKFLKIIEHSDLLIQNTENIARFNKHLNESQGRLIDMLESLVNKIDTSKPPKNWGNSDFRNNLHRSISRLYTLAFYNGIDRDPYEVRKHARYIIKWVRKHGGDIPEINES